MTTAPYDPARFQAPTFFDAVPKFLSGSDSPRAYLERCLAVIADREPVVRAWVTINEQGAREAADASNKRYAEGRPLSPVDGMPIGIKDLYETKDMPTQMGSPAYAGNFPKRDSALVQALRQAGAIILGKTVTTELGMSHPGPTTNPFDPRRTPGGSSSGSAAVIGAKMIPAAIGSQVGGSVIRPSSYCGNHAIKPTFGALNRGERQTLSQSHVGVHAGCIEDMWNVCMAISTRVGGDPGYPGLYGPESPPAEVRPQALAVMETEGWAELDEPSRKAFEQVIGQLRQAGVRILRRGDDPAIEAYESSIADLRALARDIWTFEARWTWENIVHEKPGQLSDRLLALLRRGQGITLSDYRARQAVREEACRKFAAVCALVDGFVTLSSVGPAPIWDPADTKNPRPTGDIQFNVATSALHVPAVTIPVMAVDGLPVGVQVIGPQHLDARVTGIARWMKKATAPVAISTK